MNHAHHRSGSNGSERSGHHSHHRPGHAHHRQYSGHRHEYGNGNGHSKHPDVDVLDEEVVEDVDADTRVHVEVHNVEQFWTGKCTPFRLIIPRV